MSSNEDDDDDDDDDNDDDDDDDDDKTIKDKNDILDEIIDKSQSFEEQIKSLKTIKGLKGYQHSNDCGDKELKFK